jgi:transcriptional regulator with XRE-family HTH domain
MRKNKTVREQLIDMGIKPATFGEILKAIREERGLSQGDLSAKLKNLSKSHISDIENGRRTVNLERVVELSKVLKEPLEVLMKFYFEDELHKAKLTDRYSVVVEAKKSA